MNTTDDVTILAEEELLCQIKNGQNVIIDITKACVERAVELQRRSRRPNAKLREQDTYQLKCLVDAQQNRVTKYFIDSLLKDLEPKEESDA